MYKTLLKAKKLFLYDQFKEMVEQAYKKKKITKKEYEELLKNE